MVRGVLVDEGQINKHEFRVEGWDGPRGLYGRRDVSHLNPPLSVTIGGSVPFWVQTLEESG